MFKFIVNKFDEASAKEKSKSSCKSGKYDYKRCKSCSHCQSFSLCQFCFCCVQCYTKSKCSETLVPTLAKAGFKSVIRSSSASGSSKADIQTVSKIQSDKTSAHQMRKSCPGLFAGGDPVSPSKTVRRTCSEPLLLGFYIHLFLVPKPKQGEWVKFLDFSDAYVHIPINQTSRKYLRFHLQGQTLQFRALPFGLSTSPMEFIIVVKEVKLMAQG